MPISIKTTLMVLTALSMAVGVLVPGLAAGQELYTSYPRWSDPWMYSGSYYYPYYSDSWHAYAQAWLNAAPYYYPSTTYYWNYYGWPYRTYGVGYGPYYYYDYVGPRRIAYY